MFKGPWKQFEIEGSRDRQIPLYESPESNVLNAIQNFQKHYKKFKQPRKEIDKENFKYAKLLVQKNYQYKEKILKRTLLQIRKIVKNSEKLSNLQAFFLKWKSNLKFRLKRIVLSPLIQRIMQTPSVDFFQTQQIYYNRNFPFQKLSLKSKPLKSIMSRFEVNVRILFYTLQK